MLDIRLTLRRMRPVLLAALVAPAISGCIIHDGSNDRGNGSGGAGGTGGTPNPIGSVARNASEAWPTRPDIEPITNQDIARACVTRLECAAMGSEPVGLAINLCLGQLVWSAERAIPLSNLMPSNERAEFAVRCVIDAAGDCAKINGCITGRNPAIHCEEDGCRPSAAQSFSVTCEGSIATLTMGSNSIERDCSRAYADCDPASATGCSDRQFTACPSDGNRADRCEGNIRLGCDSAGQVSYRDCERMGGSCGATSDGTVACIYATSVDPACTTNPPIAACEGADMALCVNGERIKLPAPVLCAS